jgi:Ca2+-binding EF-hand superfamily protein
MNPKIQIKKSNNKMKLREEVNPEVALKLSKMTLPQFMECSELIGKNKLPEKYQIEFESIVKYANESVKNNYNIVREYKPSEDSPEGRMFVKNIGLQNINKHFRGALCEGIYTDFDMENAHPKILKYYCNQNNIECHNLGIYIYDREEKFKDLMKTDKIKREDAKILFLTSINKNELKKNIKNEFFNLFDKEIKKIQKTIMELNPQLVNKIKQSGRVYNCGGRVLNQILCKYENKILQMAVKEFGAACLAFDGFMVSYSDEAKCLEKLNIITANYGITWSVKSHSSLLTNTILLFKDSIENLFNFSGDDINITSNQIIKVPFKNKLFVCGKNYYFLDQETNTWMSDKIIIRDRIRRWVCNNNLYLKNKKISSNQLWISQLSDDILANCEIDDTFEEQLWENSLYKICFSNGYLDFSKKKSEFIDSYENLKTLDIIKRKFNPISNPEIRKKIFEKILIPTFGNCLEHFLFRLSRTLAGRFEDKRFFLITGGRDSGKGTICDLITNSFGFYINPTNAGNFIYKDNDDREEAKKNSWMMDYQFKRLAVTNEISMDFSKRKKFIDGNMIKKFCSGGDAIEARKNYGDEVKFKVQASIMLCSNDVPEFKPLDVLEKKDEYYLNSKFVSDDVKRFEGIDYFEADSSIKTHFIKNKDVQNEFVLILMEAYDKGEVKYPEKEMNNIDNDNEGNDDELNKLYDLFEVDDSSVILNSELREINESNEFKFTLNKMRKLLKARFTKANWNYKANTKGKGVKGLKFNGILIS